MTTESSGQKRRAVHMLLVFLGLCILACIMVALGLKGIGVPCVFYKLTGLLCPGCGNTRAVLSVVKGDISAAFSYNALFIPEILYLLWVYVYCSYNYIKGKGFAYNKTPCPFIDYILLALFLLWGIIRNLI